MADRQTDAHTDGTDFILSAANAGGNAGQLTPSSLSPAPVVLPHSLEEGPGKTRMGAGEGAELGEGQGGCMGRGVGRRSGREQGKGEHGGGQYESRAQGKGSRAQGKGSREESRAGGGAGEQGRGLRGKGSLSRLLCNSTDPCLKPVTQNFL